MKTKDKILESLIDLMGSQSFELIQVKEICDAAKVNRSTYYRNFSSKEEVLLYGMKNILDEYIEKYELKEVKNRESYIHTILETFLNHENFFKTIHGQSQTYLLQKALTDYFRQELITDDLERQYSNYYHIGGIYNFTVCWIENDMDSDIDKLAHIGARITENIDPLYSDD